jgi:hypothetical protein
MKSILACVTVLVLTTTPITRHTGAGTPPRGLQGAPQGPAVLDEWGGLIASYGSTVRENALRTQIRTTIAQLAMFDAVNAVLDGPYRPFASKPASVADASPEAAAIRAAYNIALNEFPTIGGTIDSDYTRSIERLLLGGASPQAIADGVAVGDAAAQEVLKARDFDNRNLPDLDGYTPGAGPGVWITTSPTSPNPQTPFLRFVRPFGYEDPARFRPHAPPALDSRTYTSDYNEIKDVGRAVGSSRTADQAATAQFWSPSATALWTANIRSLASRMDLLTAARFEAIGVAAVTNALLACWEAKFAYMYWRPLTAIHGADTDGNAETEADPTWVPFITTPLHPEYPAAHTTVGAGALAFYTMWFHRHDLELTFTGNANAVRHYGSVTEISSEEADARVWGGMHFRNSTEVGKALGTRVGRYTATHLLKPVDE